MNLHTLPSFHIDIFVVPFLAKSNVYGRKVKKIGLRERRLQLICECFSISCSCAMKEFDAGEHAKVHLILLKARKGIELPSIREEAI